MMITVEQALAAVLEGAAPLAAENVGLSTLAGRVLAEAVHAAMTQPPFAASAMDGYAVRFQDAKPGAELKIVGEAPAGAPFDGRVGPGEAVRIFTGAVVPQGADHVVIQEDVTRKGVHIAISEPQSSPHNIRAAGIDFNKGDVLERAGVRLHEVHGSIFAAANVSSVKVYRRPRVAIFSNGDELREPGDSLLAGQIINSNHYAIGEMVGRWGAEATYLGCATDSEDSIREFFRRGCDTDIVIPVGGASVGDYDFVKSAFAKEGGKLRFEKVAVRPGKPTWCGSMGSTRVVGLPGNPASAIVTAALFLQPLVRRLAGERWTAPFGKARLASPLLANGGREAYLRGVIRENEIIPASNQDSSLLLPFASANALIRRNVNAPAANVGDEVEYVLLH